MTTKRALVRTGAALFLLCGLAGEALAIVGAPLTPMSVAGVARRTTRRTVAVTSSAAAASSAAAQQQAAAAQQQAAMAQQQAAAAQQQAAMAQQAAQLPPGTVVSGLPSGCNSMNIGGVDYFNCGGTFYRPAFQSNQVVYVVSQP